MDEPASASPPAAVAMLRRYWDEDAETYELWREHGAWSAGERAAWAAALRRYWPELARLRTWSGRVWPAALPPLDRLLGVTP